MSAKLAPFRDLGLLSGLYALAFGARFIVERDGTLNWEELLQPTASLLYLQDPSHVSLLGLQYRSFCGGCTAESLLFLPLAWLTDASLVAWKLVPLGFGLAILALLWGLARRVGGRVAATTTGAAFLLAPSFYAQNRMVAWGNHFEGAVFVLALAWLWLRWLERDERWVAALIGLLAGLGFWFCYGTALTLPLLALLALLARPRRALVHAPLVLGGGVVGLLPWIYAQWALRELGRIPADQGWLTLYGEGLGGNLMRLELLPTRLSDLLGPNFWKVSAHPGLGAGATAIGLLGWLALTGAVVAILVLGLRGWRRDGARGLAASAVALGSIYLGYLALNLALLPNWLEHGEHLSRWSLRYLGLTVPVQVLCLGLLVGWLWGKGKGARAGGLALLAMACLGGAADFTLTMRDGYASTRPLRVTAARLQHLQCGWVPALDAAGEPSEEVWLDDLLRAAPEGRVARRADLFRAGHGLGLGATRGRAAAWGASILVLEPSDREALLGGMACIIWSQRVGTDLGWRPLDGPMNGMRPLLAALDEQAGAELSDWLLAFVAAYDPHAGNALLGVHPSRIDPDRYGDTPGYAAGLARRVGQLHAQAYEGSVPALFEGSDAWDPELREAYAWGVGCKLGELWGHDPGWVEPALGQLATDDRAMAEQAFSHCAGRIFPNPRVAD